MSLVTADWNPMGDKFYRREELYCMAWADRFEVKGHLVAAAQHGGPVALMKDDQEKLSVRPTVTIYSCSGSILSSFKWKSGRVLALGWTHREELMVVQEDGQVLVYDQHGTFIRTFTMGTDVKTLRAVSACVFVSPSGTGLALLTGGVSRFVLADNTDSLRLRRLPETPGILPSPSCWAVLPVPGGPVSVPGGPVSVPGGPVSVPGGPVSVLATTGREVLLVQHGECRSVSPSRSVSELVLCGVAGCVTWPVARWPSTTDSGLLWLGTSDLQVAVATATGGLAW
uniref:Vacuolar protein sorting-associated protein 16 homolog isoform X4 n=1 Tax=Petromyzon marinus TaxID=7757 RepID=A0AAJ7SKE2_PETMA|nr:vacuolar protein sorting-associated protein 16 homolog isoform X4 [Petromyzon marinus]